MNRRQFFTAKTLAAGIAAEAAADMQAVTRGRQGGAAGVKPLRMGFVGVGGRGSFHLDTCLGLPGIQVTAICDINPDYLYRAKRYVEATGQPSPRLYGRNRTDWLRMCEKEDFDIVAVGTPWEWHTPICVAAMRNGKHAATEVPAALTLDECWELIETSEKTGRHTLMLEQVNYFQDILRLLHMAQTGMFGEILHAAGGYVHDLRFVKTDPGEEPWRMQYEFDHNGNLYPTHPIGPIAWWLNINRGDRFDTLVSISSRSGMNNAWMDRWYGPRHPYATMPMKQGDCNTSLLTTVGGKTVNLHYDTNTPHPHTGEFRLQGSRGHYAGNQQGIYIEGRSPKPDVWERYPDDYKSIDHPLWGTLDPSKYKTARGHGGGIDTALMWERYFKAIRTGTQPDMPVTDAATWSAIIPLSERSVAARGRSVDFPDFTRGKWKTTPPIKLV